MNNTQDIDELGAGIEELPEEQEPEELEPDEIID